MHAAASRRVVSSVIAARYSPAWRSHLPATQQSQLNLRLLCSSSSGYQKILMPAIMDHTRGKVTKWHKKVGDQLAVGDLLCEVAMSDFIIGVDVKQPGFLARIVAEEEKELSVGNEIAIIADTEAKFQELQIMPTETEAVTIATMLKAIKHLIDKGHLEKGDFAKQLLSLARHNNPELLAVFKSSMEGDTYSEENFDAEFFLVNVRGLVEELQGSQPEKN